jgi:hypothetical protein
MINRDESPRSDDFEEFVAEKVRMEDVVTTLIVEAGGQTFQVYGTTKTCSTCGETKPVEEFTLNARASDSRHYECRVCKARRDSSDYERHRRKRLEISRQYRKEHPDKHRQYNRDYKRRKRLEEREKRIRELGYKPWK